MRQNEKTELGIALFFFVGGLASSLGLAYVVWGPLRAWCFSQIPIGVEWGGIAKIAIVVLLGWGGGVVLPLALLIGGTLLAATAIANS